MQLDHFRLLCLWLLLSSDPVTLSSTERDQAYHRPPLVIAHQSSPTEYSFLVRWPQPRPHHRLPISEEGWLDVIRSPQRCPSSGFDETSIAINERNHLRRMQPRGNV